MTNTYKIAYPADGATVYGRLYRGTTLLETLQLDEDTDDYLNVYSKDSAETWQGGDDIVYYDGTTVIGAETYQPEATPVAGTSSLVMPAGYVGDYLQNEVIYFTWRTTAAPSVAGTVKVYKDNSDTEITNPTGITDTRNFDSQTNVHLCIIDLGASNFYAKECDYSVVLSAATISGESVNAVIATFSIENRYAGKEFIRQG